MVKYFKYRIPDQTNKFIKYKGVFSLDIYDRE